MTRKYGVKIHGKMETEIRQKTEHREYLPELER